MWTDADGLQPHPVPREMSEADIAQSIAEYAAAAKLAMQAGFDGVELHAANGYLIDQFLNTASNQRSKRWGGNVENRIGFAVEVAKASVAAIGRTASACVSRPMAYSMVRCQMPRWIRCTCV